MKVLGIIAEYNPFHFGHEYHIKKSKEETGCDHVISVMSGSFVQRGEPAFLDKWSRAEMAISGGVDLVIELPFIYASATAEIFADGAIRLLDGLNIVDKVSFGAEDDNLEILEAIAKLQVDQPNDFKEYLRFFLDQGNSFPLARSQASAKYLKNSKVSNLMNSSNNILAIEYLKSLYKNQSAIKPCLVKRKGAAYNDQNLHKEFSSASSIRKNILDLGLESVKSELPDYSYRILKDFQSKYTTFNTLDNYEDIILYLLTSSSRDDMASLPFTAEGLGDRILNNHKFNDLNRIIETSVSKTHTRSRVRRSLIYLLSQLKYDELKKLDSYHPNYVRILAANSKGLDLLSKISKDSKIPIISKFANYNRLNSKEIEMILNFDKKATDLFFLPLDNSKNNMDFIISPKIKKE